MSELHPKASLHRKVYVPPKRWRPKDSPMKIWYSVAGPGDGKGPCREECDHGNCQSAWVLARYPCGVCGRPIGFYTECVLTMKDGHLGAQHRACFETEESER